MKVLHINWSGKLGGAEKFALDLASQQKSATIAYMNKKLILGEKAKENGINVVEFNMGSGFDIINFIRYIFYIKHNKFDIIHDHNGTPLVRLSKIFCPESVFIQHIHGTKLGNEKWERTYVILWKRITNCLIDHYIANSNHTKRIAHKKEKIPLSRTSVIYNGIELSKFKKADTQSANRIRKELGIKENEQVIGTVSNLVPAKGIDKFICIAKEVKGAKFVIVGEGELRKELEHLVISLGLKDTVIFAGAREDVPAILSIFDLFLLTSNWEAFGITLIEAMAVGIPIIAFKIDGVSEVVDKGCGVLIPPKIDEAVKYINFIRENSDITKKMIDSGLRLVNEKFDIRKIATEIENIYNLNKLKWVHINCSSGRN
jgi:glycosyltransferase involved in cell wall biosynthesis